MEALPRVIRQTYIKSVDYYYFLIGLPWWLRLDKESSCNAGDLGLIPGWGRPPGEGNDWLPTPVFLPGESHGQKPGGLWPTGLRRVEHD